MKVVLTTDGESARVLVLAPIGRDAPASAELLRRVGLDAEVCKSLSDLVKNVNAGAAAVLVAEEALFGEDTSALSAWIRRQPPWSDLPFVVLTSHVEQPAVTRWRHELVTWLRHVSLLERPVQAITLTSTVQTAVRARLRQYEVRALLEAQQRASLELESLVHARTRQLEAANDALRTEMAERTRIEESFRQAQRIEAIGQLTGGVAHDFNNLLMVILGGLEMFDRHADPERRKLLMDGMRQAAQRGAAVTRQLLAFSRRQPLQSQSVDLALHVGGMRELLNRTLREDVHVELDFVEDLWRVEVDPGELELVLLNLAVNARDAMPTGGTITIRGENAPEIEQEDLHGDFVRLSVIDTGIGIAPEVRDRIFEPFFTTKEVGRGSGLGLAQVYGFAKQSLGAVSVDSEVGRGTSVVLLLPRSTDKPAAPLRHFATLETRHWDADAAGAVLLVEDNDEVAATVSEMLDELGYEVTRVASASAALGALANGSKVDVVFSDIMMPGDMDGVDLGRQVRARGDDIPVLLTSGFADAAVRRAESEGFGVLPKPYSLNDLASALKMAREKFGALRSGARGANP
jgi:signal transduction histidine kinase/ActR/RegA family two-component response regulator